MSSFDLMTSPPSSTAPSPSLASLALIPSLSPSYIAPVPRRASNTSFTAPSSPPPRSPGCVPAGLPFDDLDRPLPDLPTPAIQARASHSEVVTGSPIMTFGDTNLYAARLPRPSLPASALVPILKVTVGQAPSDGRPGAQTRKPSFTIPLPLPGPPSPSTLPALSASSLRRPSLAVSHGSTDENASRRSSFTRTPYPIDEAEDYLSAQGDIRRVHPCDRGADNGEIKWVDPWVGGSQRTAQEGIGKSSGSGGVGIGEKAVLAKPKVGSVDVSNWSSVGMEQAWSADSQSAVEGDSLMLQS